MTCGRVLKIIFGVALFNAATGVHYGWVNRAIPEAEIDLFVSRLAVNIAAL